MAGPPTLAAECAFQVSPEAVSRLRRK